MDEKQLRLFNLLRANFIKAFKEDYDVQMNLYINDENEKEFIIDYEIGINYIVNSIQMCDMSYGTTVEEFLEGEIDELKNILEIERISLEKYDVKLYKRMIRFFNKQLKQIESAKNNIAEIV